MAKVTIATPLESTAMRARASGPQSRFSGSGVTGTGAVNVRPRSDERTTTTRLPSVRTSHSVPSGPKAGVAVKASGVPRPAWLCCAAAMPAGSRRARQRRRRRMAFPFYTFQNRIRRPAMAVNGMPSAGIAEALTVGPSNVVVV